MATPTTDAAVGSWVNALIAHGYEYVPDQAALLRFADNHRDLALDRLVVSTPQFASQAAQALEAHWRRTG